MVAYSDVVKAAAKLEATRTAYLAEKGWTLNKVGRWFIDIPWGTTSTKRVEGDLCDAVRWQARHDGDIE